MANISYLLHFLPKRLKPFCRQFPFCLHMAGTDSRECEQLAGSKVVTLEDSGIMALTNADDKIRSGQAGNLIFY